MELKRLIDSLFLGVVFRGSLTLWRPLTVNTDVNVSCLRWQGNNRITLKEEPLWPCNRVSKSLQTVRIILIELILNTQTCGRSRRELQQLIPEQPLRRVTSADYKTSPAAELDPLKPTVRIPEASSRSRACREEKHPSRVIMTQF